MLVASSQEICCVGCIFTGDWRALPRATFHHRLPSLALPSNHSPYLVYTVCAYYVYAYTTCVRITCIRMYTPCAHITCTYAYTVCTYCVYIRIHPVHVLHVHTYCLGGVLLEGLRIRLTSDYSVEAAPGRDGYISLYTTAC